MVVKKTRRAKAKTSTKRKPRGKSSSKFPCPNSGKQLGVEALIRRMRKDRAFAQFIHELLCDSYSEDKETAEAAQNCLDSYYQPTGDELTTICFPKKYQEALDKCTVHPKNLLIAVPAVYFAPKGC